MEKHLVGYAVLRNHKMLVLITVRNITDKMYARRRIIFDKYVVVVVVVPKEHVSKTKLLFLRCKQSFELIFHYLVRQINKLRIWLETMLQCLHFRIDQRWPDLRVER
jgi:hypothetical protein